MTKEITIDGVSHTFDEETLELVHTLLSDSLDDARDMYGMENDKRMDEIEILCDLLK